MIGATAMMEVISILVVFCSGYYLGWSERNRKALIDAEFARLDRIIKKALKECGNA